MTRAMLMALSAAHAAAHSGGLRYCKAGWRVEGAHLEFHKYQTVNALVDRGMLEVWGKGQQRYCVVTDLGRVALDNALVRGAD